MTFWVTTGGMKMEKHICEIVQRVKKFLDERLGAQLKAVILYGSHARGRATEDSDVDLLVVVDDSLKPDEVRRSLSDLLLDILLEEGELVSVLVLSESFYRSYNSPRRSFSEVRESDVAIVGNGRRPLTMTSLPSMEEQPISATLSLFVRRATGSKATPCRTQTRTIVPTVGGFATTR